MQDKPYPNTKNNKIKAIIIGFSAMLLLAIVGYFNQNLVYTGYYYLFKTDSFSAGDKMYSPYRKKIQLWRLIRPINKDDIDTMQISDTEKLRWQLGLDDSLKPYIINVGDYVSVSDKSSYIGTYIDHEFARAIAYDTKKMGFVNVFSLKPDKGKLHKNEYVLEDERVPKDYTWANNLYYVPAVLISKK